MLGRGLLLFFLLLLFLLLLLLLLLLLESVVLGWCLRLVIGGLVMVCDG